MTLPDYDRFAQAGMAFTEKQGGSDLRANSTIAEPVGDGWYELTGHKWFCTHPVFEVFFTLAQTDAGITCFVANRPHPGFRIQRLKDKLGGRCLASSEVEYDHLPARMLGEEGRGTAFIVEQLVYTRLDTLIAVTGLMRRAVAEAVWHTRHRNAFGAPLADQPAMRNVLADLALESEAATAATIRLARAFDDASGRVGVPATGAGGAEVLGLQARRPTRRRGARVPGRQRLCRGGAMAQLYRDIQLGTVWEGSGNVIALDVLRASPGNPSRCARSWPSASSPRAPTHATMPTWDAAGASAGPPRPLPEAEWRARRSGRGHGARAPGLAAAAPLPRVRVLGLLCRAPRASRPGLRGPPEGRRGQAIVARALVLDGPPGRLQHRLTRRDAADGQLAARPAHARLRVVRHQRRADPSGRVDPRARRGRPRPGGGLLRALRQRLMVIDGTPHPPRRAPSCDSIRSCAGRSTTTATRSPRS